MEARNKDGVKLILGDSCILDSPTLLCESAELLSWWVWMEDPDELPRAVEYSLFAAHNFNGLRSSPPVDELGDRVILIHLVAYEDWHPCSLNASSGTSSGNGSSAPAVVPFTWTPGVLDGRQPAGGRQQHLGAPCDASGACI
jgi:hypothetical protein